MSLRRSHLTGLDGIRALAVLSVVAYHLDFSWARGGFLGVDIFFVLSGFLITTLLLEERVETGRLVLVEFWRRRARRLLPALFLMIIVVVGAPLITSRVFGSNALASVDLSQLRGLGFASVFYYANWFAITSGPGYFAQFSGLSPLAHTWSLAIEEQFYLVWPLLTYLLIRRGVGVSRRIGVAVSITVALVSSALMAILFHPNSPSSLNFVYNASFTRLFDLAVGAALAWLVVERPALEQSRRWLDPLGALALTALLVAFYFAGTSSSQPGNAVPTNFMFYGGFLLCALAALVVIAAVRVDDSWLARIFSWRPLRAIGQVSYGIYLWHWPVIIYITPATVHLAGKRLLLLRLVLIAAATLASYFLLEKPIRQRRWPVAFRSVVALGGSLATVFVVLVATSASLFPLPSLRTELARYAPLTPPSGSGDVVGTVSNQWITQGHYSATHKIPVMVMGDSVAYYAGPGLRAALASIPEVHPLIQAFVGDGLRTKSDWPFFLSRVAQTHPKVVIFLNAYDELTALRHPKMYTAYVEQFTGDLLAQGVQDVIFATTPFAHSPSYLGYSGKSEQRWEHGFKLANIAWRRVALATVAHFAGHALYFPVGRAVQIGSNYAGWLPPPSEPHAARATWERVHMIDGVHLCPIGTEQYGAAMIYDLAAQLNLSAPRPGWWLGNWPQQKLPYFSPTPGWCPNDHPPAS
jgi:peptidoglycan/LPS O-acetylase OafA/YrhL